MYETIKTIFHASIETQKATQTPYNPMAHSTLNEKFQVGEAEALPEGVYPEMGYIAIGRGAHTYGLDSGGRVKPNILSHDINHACLYEHIPFIARPVDEDLSPAERAKYGGRVMREYNGQAYFVYFLKAVNISTSAPRLETVTTLDNETTTAEYVPTTAQLNPTASQMSLTNSNSANNPSSGQHIQVVADLAFVLEKEDIAEIMNAIMIMFGEEDYGTISEIGVVSAIPQVINTTLGGLNVSYTEALAATIVTHIPANIHLPLVSERVTERYSLGNVLPRVR